MRHFNNRDDDHETATTDDVDGLSSRNGNDGSASGECVDSQPTGNSEFLWPSKFSRKKKKKKKNYSGHREAIFR